MTRFICAPGSAVVLSGASLSTQAQAPAPSSKGTEILTPQGRADARNLIEDVKTIGCIRLWKPAPDDPTRTPPDHQVEITGAAQTAPMPPTVQEIATAPTMRPENKPTTNGMPRLTVTTLKMVGDSCP